MRRPKTNRHLRTLLQLLGCCAAILCIWQVPKIGSNFVVYLVSRILFMGLMAMSMNLLMGFGGLTSLAQAGFAGISGYAFAICRATYKMDYIPSVLIALGLVLAVAVLFGFLSSRTSGTTFMMMTLALANLISVHQKKYIGSLSAYCGAVSAATGAACGVAYLKLKGKISEEALYRVMSDTITNSICTIGGMVCDGAKSSCAAKIAAALESAFTGLEMSLKQRVFQPGEGLTMDSVEDTIAAVGRMGRVGMKSTDVEILNIMLGH